MNISISEEIFNDIYIPYVQDYTHRYEIYKGSAASGKSYFVAQKLIIKALSDRRKILALRKIGTTVRDSIWTMFLDILEQFHILDQCIINKTTFTLELPNGSIIICKGLDDPEKIKSIANLTDIFMEEATEFTSEDAQQLDLRLRSQSPQLQIFYALNPVSKANWIYKKYFDPQTSVVNPDTTLIIETTYKDNKFIPSEYVAALEAMINDDPYMYKVYVLGEWASLNKRVYNNYQVQDFDINEIKRTYKSYFGLDYGFVSDPAALIAAAVDKENMIIYIYDEFTKTGLVNSAIVDVIKRRGYSKEVITADSAEKKSTEEIRRSGISRIKNAKKGPDSVIFGIKKIQSYKIIVHRSCEQTIVELDNYTWQKDRQSGEYIEKPVDSYNHLLDALRYALEDLDQNRLRSMSKLSLGL